MKFNPLLCTDVYKMSHMTMYAPGTTKVYSYLTTRSDKKFKDVMFFGLQYYLREYLSKPITPEMGEEFLEVRRSILGSNDPEVTEKIRALCRLGYWPLKIKAVPEGAVLPVNNVLMTITNTHPDFPWCVGFVESLLLKVWYSCTVATQSLEYRRTVDEFFDKTVDDSQFHLKPFMVHDFGYRGASDEEGSAVSGAAHLVNFYGSDTVPAYMFIREYYGGSEIEPIMSSVPASEHSVMCSYGRGGELDAFRNILAKNPTGIVSIVSDTFDVYNVLTTFCETLKEEILGRDGKTVFRPDSGDPKTIICGDQTGRDTPESLGCLRLLDRMFGHTVNSKGYKVLNEKVGLIYGDGMYLERYQDILSRMEEMCYAASNLVIGVGGILRNHTRDTMGFAIKATYVEVNGECREIEKDPVTDPGKKSRKGLLSLSMSERGWLTTDQVSPDDESSGCLYDTFIDGEICDGDVRFSDIRSTATVAIRFLRMLRGEWDSSDVKSRVASIASGVIDSLVSAG